MLGRIKSAKTKGEWQNFKKYLYDEERYKIELEAYKCLPFGNEIIKMLDYMLSVDVTTVYDEKNNILDFQVQHDLEKYKDNKTRRFTILKEFFEREDPIEQANFKCYVLETIWISICSLLEFEPVSMKTNQERKMFDNFERSIKDGITVKQKIDAIKIYSTFISQRFFRTYPRLKENNVFVESITGLLMNILLMAKTKGEIRFENIRKLPSNKENKSTKKPLQQRLDSNYDPYRRIIFFTRCMSEKLPALSGAQKKACDLERIAPSSFAKWKSDNLDDYWEIYNSATAEELEKAFIIVKKTYLG